MSDKCIVYGCLNHKHQGFFITGDLCMPCYNMITSGEIKHGETFVHKLRDRIEELVVERDEAWKRAAHAEKMWGEAEVKLATAVELVEKSIKWLRLYGADLHRDAATLAELTSSEAAYNKVKGGKDEC